MVLKPVISIAEKAYCLLEFVRVRVKIFSNSMLGSRV